MNRKAGFTLLLAVCLCFPELSSLPAGSTLSPEDAGLRFGGQAGGSSPDRICGCSSECTVPIPEPTCGRFGSDAEPCAMNGSAFEDRFGDDIPQDCNVDSMGSQCSVNNKYECAVEYNCWFNELTMACEADVLENPTSHSGGSLCAGDISL